MYETPTDPAALWSRYRVPLSEDFLHTERLRLRNMALPHGPDVENRALRHIQELLELQGPCLADYPGIPVPPALAAHAEQQPMLIARELDYDAAHLQESVVAQTAMLNADQQYVY